METNHNCIGKIREKMITETPSINYIRFDLSRIESFKNNKSNGIRKTGTNIWIGIEKVNKNGDKKIVEKKSFITHKYCPWCGEKYE